MQNPELRADYKQYLLLNSLYRYAVTVFGLPVYLGDLKATHPVAHSMIEDVVSRATGLGLDEKEVRKKAVEEMTRLARVGEQPRPNWREVGGGAAKRQKRRSTAESGIETVVTERNGLSSFLRSYLDEIEGRIAAVPNSDKKAQIGLLAFVEDDWPPESDQTCDAAVLLSQELADGTVSRFINVWQEERESFRAHQHNFGEIFWISGNYRHMDNAASRYRFAETFDISGFDSAFRETEEMIGDSLLEPTPEIRRLAYSAWLVSRSKKLVHRLPHAVDVAVRRLSTSQNGVFWTEWWDIDGKLTQLPSITTTGYASVALLKLAASEAVRENATQAALWLLEHQNPDGSWSNDDYKEGLLVKEPDLFVTLLAMEAVVRTSSARPQLERARAWVRKQQDSLGFWQHKFLGFPFTSVLALETLRRTEAVTQHIDDEYLRASEGYLRRSMSLSGEDNVTASRLALIAAHQGVEAFLYSVMQTKNIGSVWSKDNPSQTVGMRIAVKSLQEWLKKHKRLRADEVIPGRPSLDRLAYLRDEVVHKAANPSRPDVKRLVAEAAVFCS